ncbi:redoxin family protein [Morganella morganii]|uniref:redoxin family protein n=1 Tax=Morganella morganii TaxID=582 RepID=UPI0021D06942|nr:redoxin family protein [Morganella morganii]MCU6274019.1 redoxin family protein [Morganella morganii]
MKISISSNHINFGTDFRVRFGENPLTLDKGVMQIGSPLPEVSCLVTPDLAQAELPSDVRKVFLTVPSLDTPVCESQIKTLSEALNSGAEADAIYYVVSVDTPFAQARFIREHGINPAIHFLSDYAEHRFMRDTGLRIIELNIFARAVITCDESNHVLSISVLEDITQLP